MKSKVSKCAIVFFGLMSIVIAPVAARGADPGWKAVEQALGKSGQLQPGDVCRVGMPRTDLTVTVKGVPVKAGFALGSYAAFFFQAEDGIRDLIVTGVQTCALPI